MEIPFSVRYNNTKLEVERLYKTSNQSKKRLFSGLEDISFSVRGGECIHLKSSVPWASQLLLNTLTGHTAIEAGAIWVHHQNQWLNLPQLSSRQVSQIHAQTIGYLGPSENLRSQSTVLDCVLTKLIAFDVSRSQAAAQSRQILDWVGLPRCLWHKAPTHLSLPELHQVNLARTFAADYSIIVIGLPISQLDPANQMRLLELIEYRKAKNTCFIGRFDQDALRVRVCDRSLSIHVPTPISAAARRQLTNIPTVISKGIPTAMATTGVAVSSTAARSY
ncbi:MAG: hypothetical protein AAF959_05710 [Cyanobacteria bacterium P01_D01_bin.56]